MIRKYQEIRIQTDIDIGDLFGVLEDSGCLGACEIDGKACLYWSESQWGTETLNRVREVLAQFGDAKAIYTIAVAEMPDRDWNSQWTESLRPIRIGRKPFWIVARKVGMPSVPRFVQATAPTAGPQARS